MIVIAHAGWDELVIFAVVGLVGVYLVRRAERKARERADSEPPAPGGSE